MYNQDNDKKGDPVYEGVKQEFGVPPGHSRFYCEKCQAVSNFALLLPHQVKVCFCQILDMCMVCVVVAVVAVVAVVSYHVILF
jgi:hypothetical protein